MLKTPRATSFAHWTSREGAALPFGVYFVAEEDAYNFTLYSKHATAVTLQLYAAGNAFAPIQRCRFDPRINKTGRVWHVRLPARIVEQARYYAYRVDGPWDPSGGHRFDGAKLLLDPYARAIHFPSEFSREAAISRGNNAGRAPLGVLPPREASKPGATGAKRAVRHGSDAIVYELHVRGFTIDPSSGVPLARRGTFSGLLEKLPHLVELGVTVVELMPIFQFDPQEGNFWGYSPISFFAAHHAYQVLDGESTELVELRELIHALHEAGIEVVLDVVYNHTGEVGADGPTYSFRGIDNSTYYLLEEDRSQYRNDSGCGNVLHTANRAVRTQVLDSLRYWASSIGVDGFRFDLASLFTRTEDGRIDLEQAPIISEISSHPALSDTRLIGEAWDMSAYQLGRSFPGVSWLQWNGRFRDEVRAFVRGDPGYVPALIRRLYGSDDLFPDSLMDAYHPYQSVNFVTCHDGFTLYDVVAYDRKHNEANGEGNRDGNDLNFSWNCGWEGDAGAPDEVLALRGRQARNLFCLLMLANGTPMFRAGDEFLQTQGGNNNAYNQDNRTSWIDWTRRNLNRDFFRFAKSMIAFRKAHPSIARSRYWREDVTWHGVGPEPDLRPESHSLAYHLRGSSEGDTDLYVMINAWWEDLEFEIQAEGSWLRVVDTSLASPDEIADAGKEMPVGSERYSVRARSVVVLLQARMQSDSPGS
jgi:glycogen operon protein